MLIFLEILEEEDRESFREIYEKNYLKMYHVSYGILKHPEDTENAVHDSFAKLAELYDRYKHLPPEKMASLCTTIVKNKSIDIIRKRKRLSVKEIEDEMLEMSEPDILSHIIKNEEEELLREKLGGLSEPLKLVLILKYYHRFKSKEIAKILDITPRTVEMRLHRAKQKLREELGNDRESI
ncbi:MAG: sigma-70 family RNA polymerase sigma factor [Lachnospiraceae bacterium]